MRLRLREKEVASWIRQFADREHYEAYFTYNKELLLSPLTSTSTLDSVLAVLKTIYVESEISKALSEKGIRSYRCTINWVLGLFVFREVEEFIRWTKDHISPKKTDRPDQITKFNPRKYKALVTEEHDVVLRPGVTTPPVKKAYIPRLSDGDLLSVLTVLEIPDPKDPEKKLSVPIVRVQGIDWREDQPTASTAT